MIHDVTLRWVVTALFVFSAAVCLRAIAAGRHSAASTVSHSLHAVMAIAMAAMAWPRGAELPPRSPMLFFLAAAVWFAAVLLRAGDHRLANGYHTAMMLAMAWMYAAMGGLALPTAAPVAAADTGHSGHGGHGGHGGSAAAAAPAQSVDWVAALNWGCTLGFGAAAAFWLYRLVTARLAPPPDGSDPSLGIACQLAMATGMAVMFAAML